MITSNSHTFHPMDVKNIQETDQQLIIDFCPPRATSISGAMTWLVFILVPYVLVFGVLQSFDLLDNTLVRVVMMLAACLVVLVLFAVSVVVWEVYTDHPVLITFDRKSGLMIVVQGENTRTMPLMDIHAIILVNVHRGKGYVQLLLERTDGVIVSLDLESKIALTSPMEDKQYEPLAQRIHQFLGLFAPIRSVSRQTYWQGERDLVAGTPAHASDNC